MTTESQTSIALSIRQPWATLLVCGLKSIEIRAWSTERRGRILIHASKTPDSRPVGWRLLPAKFGPIAKLRGGLIGSGKLTGCIPYRSIKSFSADQNRHLNEPSWFHGRVLYGFTFCDPEVLPFRRYPGWMRFFAVDEQVLGRDEAQQFAEFRE
jgi:hypothetical protein